MTQNRAEPYPVLYLLQDEGQSYREWVELGRLQQILDNLTIAGDAEPMVVVMGDGEVDDIRGEVVKNLLPAAEGAFNVSSDGEDRAIAGYRARGRAGSQPSGRATGEFSNVGSFSGDLEATGNGAGRSARARRGRSTTRPTSSVCTSATSPTRTTTRR